MPNRVFNIATLGFEDKELYLINSILSLTKSRDRSYRIMSDLGANHADIVLISHTANTPTWPHDVTHHRSLKAPKLYFLENTKTDNTNDFEYTITRPILPTKLLKTLDEITVKKLGYAPEVLSEAPSSYKHDTQFNISEANAYKYNVLVVDDSIPVQQTLVAKLDSMRIKSEVAGSGEEALDKINSNAYNLIFLDVTLPKMDGYEVCKTIKTDKHLKQTPICMLTGKTSSLNKIKGKMSGCDSYLTKPVQLNELVNFIMKHLPELNEAAG